MNSIKLTIHSVVDLITNSSTTIFTYQNGALPALKELVDEMLKAFNVNDKTFDDIFYAGVFCDDDVYFEFGEHPEDLRDETFAELKMQVLKGEAEKPQWMIDAEEEESRCEYFCPDSSLEIMPKDTAYSELANKLLSYLNSPDHEATREG